MSLTLSDPAEFLPLGTAPGLTPMQGFVLHTEFSAEDTESQG